MKTKRELETALLVFAITSIIWCATFAYILGEVSREYEAKIELIGE